MRAQNDSSEGSSKPWGSRLIARRLSKRHTQPSSSVLPTTFMTPNLSNENQDDYNRVRKLSLSGGKRLSGPEEKTVLADILSKDVNDWSVSEVKQWLGYILCGQYIYVFAHHFVDGETLKMADEAFLRDELNITDQDNRLHILNKLNEIRGEPPPKQPTMDTAGKIRLILQETEERLELLKEMMEPSQPARSTEPLSISAVAPKRSVRFAKPLCSSASSVDLNVESEYDCSDESDRKPNPKRLSDTEHRRIKKDMKIDEILKSSAFTDDTVTRIAVPLQHIFEPKSDANDGVKSMIQEEQYGCLHPEHPYRLHWDILMLILVVYYAIMTPVSMGFGIAESIVVELIFTSLFFLDMALNFVTPFKIETGPNASTMETDVRVISRQYLRQWFWIDLVSTIPIDIILLYNGSSETSSSGFNKIFRLFKGFKLVRVLRMSRIFQRLLSQQRFNPAILRLWKLFGILVVMWHWIGCFYWLIASVEGFGTTVWVPSVADSNERMSRQYLQAYHWAVTVTTGIGAEISPDTDLETIFTMLSTITGVIMYAFIVGSAGTAMTDIDTHGAEHRRKIQRISQFMLQRHVPRDLRKSVLTYYDYSFAQSQFGAQNERDMFPDLHVSLRMRLHKWMNRDIIHSVKMFRDISEDCQGMLISMLKSHIYLPQETVVVERQRSQGLFFIVRGRFEVWDNYRIVALLGPGLTFGKRALLTAERRSTTVRASTHGELLLLRRKDFRKVVRLFPEFAASLQKYMFQPPGYYLRGWQKVAFVVRMTRMTRLLGAKGVSFEGMMHEVNNVDTSDGGDDKRQHREQYRPMNAVVRRASRLGRNASVVMSGASKSTQRDSESKAKTSHVVHELPEGVAGCMSDSQADSSTRWASPRKPHL